MSEAVFAGEQAKLQQSSTEEDRPLTDEERALVARLLADPFYFPIQFKTWLVSFLEGSDLLLPRSSVQGLSSLLGSGGGQGVMGLLPAGLVFPFGGSAAPAGALLCNGAAYSRVGYKRLFDSIGTQFGAGDGSTSFNVPDLRRRIPWGAGASVPVGASDGQAEGARSLDHHHYFADTKGLNVDWVDDHTHYIGGDILRVVTDPQYGSDIRWMNPPGGSGQDTHPNGGHAHSGWVEIAGYTSGAGMQDRPAYVVLNFVINF